MPMSTDERKIIEYRANLGYKVDIHAIIDSLGDDSEKTTHVFPTEIKEALENPAGPVLKKALSLLDNFDTFLDKLETMLEDNVANGVPFEDYLKARADGNYDIMDAWESFHRNSMDGELAGELYPLMSHVRDNLSSNIEFLNQQAFLPDSTLDTSIGSAFAKNSSNKDDKVASQKESEDTVAGIFNNSLNIDTGFDYNPEDYGYTDSPAVLTKGSVNADTSTDSSTQSATNSADDLSSHYDNPDEAIEKEASELEAIVMQDVDEGTSTNMLAKLKSKTEIVLAIDTSLEGKQLLLDGAAELIDQTVDDMFTVPRYDEEEDFEDEDANEDLEEESDDSEDLQDEDDGEDDSPYTEMPGYEDDIPQDDSNDDNGIKNVIENLATASEAALSGAAKMLTITHAEEAAEVEDLAERQVKLHGKETLNIVQTEVAQLRQLMLEAEETLSWLENLDTNFESASITSVIRKKMKGVTKTIDAFQSALIDLWKLNNMEAMHAEDIIASLTEKNMTRTTYNIMDDMSNNYDPNYSTASQFTNNMGYTKAEVVKPKEKARAAGSLDRADRK